MYIRVVLILIIFEFLCWQRLIWFEINKQKYPPSFKSLSNFNLCRTAMQVSHLNNMGVLDIEISIFYSDQSNGSKNLKLCRLYLYSIIEAILQNFCRFLAIIILELQLKYCSILVLVSYRLQNYICKNYQE